MNDREDALSISKDEAQELLGDRTMVHVFLNPGGMLVGADWARGSIDKLLEEAKRIEIGGGQCRRMGHPLAVFGDNRWHFIECKIPAGKYGEIEK